MPVVAVIPVKSFATGKQRLAETLSPADRSTLGRAMVIHVSEVVETVGLLPLIVTADAGVATWAATAGLPSLPDDGEGLSAAAGVGARWASESNSRWLILHSDLPLLTVGELADVAGHCEDGSDVIAPSSDGGTSAISAASPMEFSFGPASFHRHLTRLATPVVIARTGLLHDIDSPNDLSSARSHPRGRWIDDVIA